MSSYLRNSQLRASKVQRSLASGPYVHTPGFSETVGLAYDETTANELISSRGRMRKEFLGPQMTELAAMRTDGRLTEEEWQSFRKRQRRGRDIMDWEGLAAFSNETKGTSFDFSEKSMQESQAAESEERKQILENAEGFTGFTAQLAGTMGAMANPTTAAIELASFVIPGTQLRFGSSALSSIAKMAFREGALNVGIESIYQANIYDFKKSVGQQYSLSDGAVNILAAFTFGAAVGAGRSAYNIQVGNSSVTDALAANRVIIDEMSARTDLTSTERVILRDLEQAQEIMQQVPVPTGSARQAYADTLGDIAQKHISTGMIARVVELEQGLLAEVDAPLLRNTDLMAPPLDDMLLRRRSFDAVNNAVRRYGVMERVTKPAYTDEMVLDFRARLTADASQKLPRGERQQLNRELDELQFKLSRVTDEALPPVKRRGVSARKAKQEAAKAGGRVAAEERAMLQERIDAIELRLDGDAEGRAAEGDLSRLEQGIMPERFFDEALQVADTRAADFSEQAALDDMVFMQDYFAHQVGRDDAELAGRVYNELARRDKIDLIEAQNIPHRVPDVAVEQVSADVRAAESVSPKYELPEDYVPEGDLSRPSAVFVGSGDDVQLTSRPLQELVEEADARLADAETKLKNTVACIRG